MRLTLSDYGALFRDAYALLHGGRAGEMPSVAAKRPGEPLAEYLSRSRTDALAGLGESLRALQPPAGLEKAHQLLVRLLANAVEADGALAAQVEAYRCGQYEASTAHGDRLQALVAESARLDRELILSLRDLSSESPGTLARIGLADIVPPP